MAKVEEILASVGLTSKMSFFPRQLSGGEQQRVAIARAVVAEPSAILADEPTAALESVNGHAIMTILSATAKQRRRAVLVVTHDPRLFEFADRIVHIQDGSLTCEPGFVGPSKRIITRLRRSCRPEKSLWRSAPGRLTALFTFTATHRTTHFFCAAKCLALQKWVIEEVRECATLPQHRWSSKSK